MPVLIGLLLLIALCFVIICALKVAFSLCWMVVALFRMIVRWGDAAEAMGRALREWFVERKKGGRQQTPAPWSLIQGGRR